MRLQEMPLLLQGIICRKKNQDTLFNIRLILMNMQQQIVDKSVYFRLNFRRRCTRTETIAISR